MISTNYGRKKEGYSPFVIVSPHGAGDDKKSGVIANRLATKLNGFLVVNTKYIKATNSRAKYIPDRIEDFNQLCWGHSYNKYLWRKKHPDMKQFFRDIGQYCNTAQNYNVHKKAIAIYIHGMKKNGSAMDIGIGVKLLWNRPVTACVWRMFDRNSGVMTLELHHACKLRDELKKYTAKYHPLPVTIGKHFSGWSRKSAIQFHKHGGRDDYAVQIEIDPRMRNNHAAINQTVDALSSALKQTFQIS